MRKINRIQRLAGREEKDVIKRIFVLSVISLLIIVLFFTTGIPFLGKFADLMDSVFGKSKQDVNSSVVVVQAPIIDILPKFTNSSTITVSGFSSNAVRVEIYVDSQKAGETTVDSGRFKYENLKLLEDDNNISAKAFDASGRESDLSETVKIVYSNKEPKLEVISPSESQEFSGNNRIKVEGMTQKDAQVFANGFLANVSVDGKFDVTIPLTEGENNVEIKAVDEAGNTKIVTVRVVFRK